MPGRGSTDTKDPVCFTEPLGERVKRRRQQHNTPPCSSSLNNTSTSSDVTRNSSGIGGRGSGGGSGSGGGKNGIAAKRFHGEDTSSELSVSPKRRRPKATGHRRHRLSSSESEDANLEEDDRVSTKFKVNNDDAGASSSSCLTDSPVPRKHSLQQLVEEVKCRAPSLPRLDSRRVRIFNS